MLIPQLAAIPRCLFPTSTQHYHNTTTPGSRPPSKVFRGYSHSIAIVNLPELENFLETQENAFTSILKATKNIDPDNLSRSLIKHHNKMINIARGRYPVQKSDIDEESSPVKPGSAYKRLFDSDSEAEYGPSPRNGSSFGSTPSKITPKNRQKLTKFINSSNLRTSSLKGRMQPASASNLFETKPPNYSQSPTGYKTWDVVEVSSDEASDSEFAASKEPSDIESSEGEGVKKVTSRKDVVRRAAPKKKPSPAKKLLEGHSDESDQEGGYIWKKQEESNSVQVHDVGKPEEKSISSTVDIEKFKSELAEMKDDLATREADLARITYVMERVPFLRVVKDLREQIKIKEKIVKDYAKVMRRGKKTESKAVSGRMSAKKNHLPATVEDAI